MVPADFHEFFTASASVAGALIGLLFVAISVSSARLADREAQGQLHRIRAVAALTAFTNSLTVSLFALIPGDKIGTTSVAVAAVGLGFVAASLLSLIRKRQLRWGTARDGLFLAGLAVTFVYQLLEGLAVPAHGGDSGPVDTIAILVVVSFLLGIGRSWELVNGPSIGIMHEVIALARGQRVTANDPQEGPPPARAPGTGSAGQ
ncbi:MAG: hypothetical protein M3Z75_20840 [Actinomycetota bacterium]|nr:hypothetical protein [Actinomycetota bacterium]